MDKKSKHNKKPATKEKMHKKPEQTIFKKKISGCTINIKSCSVHLSAEKLKPETVSVHKLQNG